MHRMQSSNHFGIETSKRIKHHCRIRSTIQKPSLYRLFATLDLVLVNLRVYGLWSHLIPNPFGKDLIPKIPEFIEGKAFSFLGNRGHEFRTWYQPNSSGRTPHFGVSEPCCSSWLMPLNDIFLSSVQSFSHNLYEVVDLLNRIKRPLKSQSGSAK